MKLTRRVKESDKSESPRLAGALVHHEHGLRNVSEVLEVVAKVLRGGLPGEAADEHLAIQHLIGSSLRRVVATVVGQQRVRRGRGVRGM
jgi:hypothetical protein